MKMLVVSITAVAISVMGLSVAGAQPTDPFAKFSEASDELRLRMNYDAWSAVLASTVINTGPSNRYFYRPNLEETASKLKRYHISPSWLEGNRVLFQRIEDVQAQYISDLRAGYEAIFDEREFSRLTKNQQLAYWLNLYTIGVYELVVGQYPIGDTRRIRRYWDHPVFMVAGVEMSLNDIHHNIILRYWDDPLVIYGLFQGAIGGPNIHRRAYTADNVWTLLRRNAREFVNSARGVRATFSGDLMASEIYAWSEELFPNFESDLRRHLAQFADDRTSNIMNSDDTMEAKYFDWMVADTTQGKPARASMYASAPALSIFSGGFQGSDFGVELRNVPIGSSGQPVHKDLSQFSPIEIAFQRGLELKFKVFGLPQGEVTVEEVDTDTERDIIIDEEEAQEEPPQSEILDLRIVGPTS